MSKLEVERQKSWVENPFSILALFFKYFLSLFIYLLNCFFPSNYLLKLISLKWEVILKKSVVLNWPIL